MEYGYKWDKKSKPKKPDDTKKITHQEKSTCKVERRLSFFSRSGNKTEIKKARAEHVVPRNQPTYLHAVALVPRVQPRFVLVLVVGGAARAATSSTSPTCASTPSAGTRGATSGRGRLRRDPHQIALGLANHDEGMFARWDVMLERGKKKKKKKKD